MLRQRKMVKTTESSDGYDDIFKVVERICYQTSGYPQFTSWETIAEGLDDSEAIELLAMRD